MSEISDELRKFIDDDGLFPNQIDELRCIADRIDAEMAELPRGKDGKPVKPGQTVYKAVNGDDGEYVVHSLRYSVPGWVTLIKRAGEDTSCIVRPDVLTHERPDSLERIAQEIEEAGVDGCTDWAERIRRLAGREDER